MRCKWMGCCGSREGCFAGEMKWSLGVSDELWGTVFGALTWAEPMQNAAMAGIAHRGTRTSVEIDANAR